MNKFLRIGFFSVALAQSLYAVDATAWWQLHKDNNTIPPPVVPVLPDPLTIFEDSKLTLTSVTNPTNGEQSFNGSVIFDHNLLINLTINQQNQQDQSTPIYRLNNGGRIKDFTGNGTLTLNVNAPNLYAKSIFNFDGAGDGLNLNVKTNITATKGSQIFFLFLELVDRH